MAYPDKLAPRLLSELDAPSREAAVAALVEDSLEGNKHIAQGTICIRAIEAVLRQNNDWLRKSGIVYTIAGNFCEALITFPSGHALRYFDPAEKVDRAIAGYRVERSQPLKFVHKQVLVRAGPVEEGRALDDANNALFHQMMRKIQERSDIEVTRGLADYQKFLARADIGDIFTRSLGNASVYIDVGCGIGKAGIEYAALNGAVRSYGVDIKEWMEEDTLLRHNEWMPLVDARERLQQEGRYRFVKGDMSDAKTFESLPAADLITSFFAMQYVRDQIGAFANMYNQLKAGGVMIMTVVIPRSGAMVGYFKKIQEDVNKSGNAVVSMIPYTSAESDDASVYVVLVNKITDDPFFPGMKFNGASPVKVTVSGERFVVQAPVYTDRLADETSAAAGQIARGDAQKLLAELGVQWDHPVARARFQAQYSGRIGGILGRIHDSNLSDTVKKKLSEYIKEVWRIMNVVEFGAIVLSGTEISVPGWLLGFNTIPRGPNAKKDWPLNDLQAALKDAYPNTVGLAKEVLDKIKSNNPLIEEYFFHELVCPHLGHEQARVLQEALFPENYPGYLKDNKPAGHRNGVLSSVLKQIITEISAEETPEEYQSEITDKMPEPADGLLNEGSELDRNIKKPRTEDDIMADINERLQIADARLEDLERIKDPKEARRIIIDEIRLVLIGASGEINTIEDSGDRQFYRRQYLEVMESMVGKFQKTTDNFVRELKKTPRVGGKIAQVRALIRFSEKKMSEELGVSEDVYRAWEQGKDENIPQDILRKMERKAGFPQGTVSQPFRSLGGAAAGKGEAARELVLECLEQHGGMMTRPAIHEWLKQHDPKEIDAAIARLVSNGQLKITDKDVITTSTSIRPQEKIRAESVYKDYFETLFEVNVRLFVLLARRMKAKRVSDQAALVSAKIDTLNCLTSLLKEIDAFGERLKKLPPDIQMAENHRKAKEEFKKALDMIAKNNEPAASAAVVGALNVVSRAREGILKARIFSSRAKIRVYKEDGKIVMRQQRYIKPDDAAKTLVPSYGERTFALRWQAGRSLDEQADGILDERDRLSECLDRISKDLAKSEAGTPDLSAENSTHVLAELKGVLVEEKRLARIALSAARELIELGETSSVKHLLPIAKRYLVLRIEDIDSMLYYLKTGRVEPFREIVSRDNDGFMARINKISVFLKSGDYQPARNNAYGLYQKVKPHLAEPDLAGLDSSLWPLIREIEKALKAPSADDRQAHRDAATFWAGLVKAKLEDSQRLAEFMELFRAEYETRRLAGNKQYLKEDTFIDIFEAFIKDKQLARGSPRAHSFEILCYLAAFISMKNPAFNPIHTLCRIVEIDDIDRVLRTKRLSKLTNTKKILEKFKTKQFIRRLDTTKRTELLIAMTQDAGINEAGRFELAKAFAISRRNLHRAYKVPPAEAVNTDQAGTGVGLNKGTDLGLQPEPSRNTETTIRLPIAGEPVVNASENAKTMPEDDIGMILHETQGIMQAFRSWMSMLEIGGLDKGLITEFDEIYAELKRPINDIRVEWLLRKLYSQFSEEQIAKIKETVRSKVSPTFKYGDEGYDREKILDTISIYARILRLFSRYHLGEETRSKANVRLNDIISCYPHVKSQLGKTVVFNLLAGDVTLYTDEVALFQIIKNLLRNAMEASAFGRENKIIVTTSLSEDKKLIFIRIEDHGVGISREDLPKIFTAGFTTKEYGKGLGLAIVKDLVETRCSGTISVKSEPGKGTTFTLRLPIADIASSGRAGAIPKGDTPQAKTEGTRDVSKRDTQSGGVSQSDTSLKLTDAVESNHALTAAVMKAHPFQGNSKILLSENLFSIEDTAQLRRILGPDSHIQIMAPQDIRNASTNGYTTKENVACVIDKNDYDNPELWDKNHKAQSRATMLILGEDLRGDRYLHVEGVVGLARALMTNDPDAVTRFISSLFRKTDDMDGAAMLDLLIKDPRAFADRIKFKPVNPADIEGLDKHNRIAVETYLSAA